jgi:hypothetical protein
MNVNAVIGDTNIYEIFVLLNDLPFPLTSADEVKLLVRENRQAVDLQFSKNATVVDSELGKAELRLEIADLAAYQDGDNFVYDLKLIEADGSVSTLATGAFLLVETASRTLV